MVIVKEKNKEEINMNIFIEVLNKLIKDEKIKFSFYNNSLLDLELLQVCYDESKNALELEFRDVMGEHLKELRDILDRR